MPIPVLQAAELHDPTWTKRQKEQQCLCAVVSHTVSAGLLLRVQAHLENDDCLHMVWLVSASSRHLSGVLVFSEATLLKLCG